MERVLSKYKRLWLKLNLKKLLRDRHVDVHAFTEGKVNTLMEKCVAATRKLALQLHHSMGHDPSALVHTVTDRFVQKAQEGKITSTEKSRSHRKRFTHDLNRDIAPDEHNVLSCT